MSTSSDPLAVPLGGALTGLSGTASRTRPPHAEAGATVRLACLGGLVAARRGRSLAGLRPALAAPATRLAARRPALPVVVATMLAGMAGAQPA
jgi:hypothetical protein